MNPTKQTKVTSVSLAPKKTASSVAAPKKTTSTTSAIKPGKQEVTTTSAPTPKPTKGLTSQKFDPHKQAAILDTDKKFKTNFAASYHREQIPCHIDHGSIKMRLQWDKDPSLLDFNPLLLLCAEGLQETEHPYVFISKAATLELINSPGASDKIIPILSKMVPFVRLALKSKRKETSDSAMEVIVDLAKVVGEELQPFLKDLLVTLGVKLASKDQNQLAQQCLTSICESNKDAYQIVKQKVPTFQF